MHPAAAQALFEKEVATLSPALAERRRWIFHTIAFPLIDCSFTAPGRTTLRVRLRCDDWNDLAPSISLHAADGGLLTSLPPNPTSVFHSGPHPTANRPFICMAGSREYHTHPSHLNDIWENHKGRSSFDLGGILTQVWNAWQKGQG
jgi:Predicted metal binding domain